MDKRISLEFYWWIFTAIIAVAILFPILNKIPDYPFLIPNVVFIVAFVTFTRFIFLLEHTFIAHQQYLKIAIVLVSLIVIFYLINQINIFQTFLDEEGPDVLVKHLSAGQQSMANYIRSEYLFFGVGSVIAVIILPFRLIVSIWRSYNRGTV
ncbi:MAG: hypothetical protein AB8G22_14905 [Saprospiraceae bacterium]